MQYGSELSLYFHSLTGHSLSPKEDATCHRSIDKDGDLIFARIAVKRKGCVYRVDRAIDPDEPIEVLTEICREMVNDMRVALKGHRDVTS